MNQWIEHLKNFYAKNKNKMSYKEAMTEAKKTYKPSPKKEKKPRKPMDETRKARLLEQLARGRETSRLNRKKRAEAKKNKQKKI